MTATPPTTIPQPVPATAPGLRSAAYSVAATALLATVLGLLQALLSEESAAGYLLAAGSLPLFFGFWLGSSWLVDAAAPLLGEKRRLEGYLASNGRVFPLLIGYAIALLLQTGCYRLGWTPGVQLGWVAAMGDLLIFLAFQVRAVKATYSVSGLAAISLALLPYAAMALLSMLLLLGLSIFA